MVASRIRRVPLAFICCGLEPKTTRSQVQPAMKALLLLLLMGSFHPTESLSESTLSQGIKLLRQGRPQQALPILERSVAEEPKSEQAHYYYGVALAEMGDPRGA